MGILGGWATYLLAGCIGVVAILFGSGQGPDLSALRRFFGKGNLVASTIDGYDSPFDATAADKSLPRVPTKGRDLKAQPYDPSVQQSDQDVTNSYYNIATDFYEYGWGQSFHFAPRMRGMETFRESLKRHEHFIADNLFGDGRGGSGKGKGEGKKVLDMGSGVGGPLREFAYYSRASVVGVTLNEYQIQRCQAINKEWFPEPDLDLRPLVDCKQQDFTKLSLFADESFDHIYSIEAHCHLSTRVPALKEAMRVLKPGGKIFVYDWVMTKRYDSSSEEHLNIKRGVEHGDGLADLIPAEDLRKDYAAAGFRIREFYDLAVEPQRSIVTVGPDAKNKEIEILPWYHPLDWKIDEYLLENFAATPPGRMLTHAMVTVTEGLGLAPQGTVATHAMLVDGADNLVKGGHTGIFTPMWVVLAEKG